MEAKPFILIETSFRIFGYNWAIPNSRNLPVMTKDFNVLGAADASNVDMAMHAVWKLLCATVQNMANNKSESQFDSYHLS